MKIWKASLMTGVGIIAMTMTGAFIFSSSIAPRALAVTELQQVKGGQWYYCVGSAIDPNGTNCDKCLSDGNNGSTKCDTPGLDMTVQFAHGQSPAQIWDLSEAQCTGIADKFSDAACQSPMVGFFDPCRRTYTAATFIGYAGGVYCGY